MDQKQQAQDQWNNQEKIIINAGCDKDMMPVYIIVGNRINQDNMRSMIAIKDFNDQLLTNYPFNFYNGIFIYDDNSKYTSKQIDFLKNLKKGTPKLQLQRLQKILIINYTRYFKSAYFFSSNTIKKKFVYVNLEKLQLELKYTDIQWNAIKQLCLNIKAIITTIQTKQFYGKNIEEYQLTNEGVPVFMDEIIKYFRQNQPYLMKQGVFRLSGSVVQEKELIQDFSNDNYTTIEKHNPDVVSTVLKNSLLNMPEPLFPFVVYDKLKQYPPIGDDFFPYWEAVIYNLDKVNQKTLVSLISFLNHVASFEKSNKMGYENLSIVFAPCLLRSQVASFDDYMKIKNVVTAQFASLIKNSNHFVQFISGQMNNNTTFNYFDQDSQQEQSFTEGLSPKDNNNINPMYASFIYTQTELNEEKIPKKNKKI